MQSFSSLNEKMRRGEKHPRLSQASDVQFFRVKNPIQAGGGPYRLLPCSAKTVCRRLIKRYEFQYNYIGHHMKQFLVDSNLGCCHGNAFVKERLAKMSSFLVKNYLFLSQKVFLSAFLIQIQNQRLKIDPCVKFQPDWTKDKGSSNFDLEHYRNCLMTSLLLHSDDVIKISIDFVRCCSRVPSCQVWKK